MRIVWTKGDNRQWGDYLYFAILTADRNMTAALKRRGITISEEEVRMLTEGGGGNEWFAYCELTGNIKDEDFVCVMSTLITEINAPQAAGDLPATSGENCERDDPL